MIVLRPMRDMEYPAYLDYFIPDYAAEISANYALSPAAALAQAQREIAADLPDGVNTRGQVLCCLFDDSDGAEKRVGYLWYKPDEEMRSAFICDFLYLSGVSGTGPG
ncbi:N-acetyltransferase GCN5 [Klebsiella michiganensis]|nr:N-acetyltransferase GCN5 [Klebsiella michiganensis]